jgi:hypothetical protein
MKNHDPATVQYDIETFTLDLVHPGQAIPPGGMLEKRFCRYFMESSESEVVALSRLITLEGR